MKTGYGLCNGTVTFDGFVYHGHDGAVPGGLTQMEYMPDNGVGYFYSINSDNGEAFTKIGMAIRAYVTRTLTRPTVPRPGHLPADADDYAGWYEPAALRQKAWEYWELVFGLQHVHFGDGQLRVTTLFQGNRTFAPTVGMHFRLVGDKGAQVPIATAALIAPNADGRFILVGALAKQIPTWLALGRIGLAICLLVTVISNLVYAPFWTLAELNRKRRRPAERAVRLWPLVSVLSLLVAFMIPKVCNRDFAQCFESPTTWSVSLFFATLVFGFASLVSAVAQWSARKQPIRRGVRWCSMGATVVLLAVTAYLAHHGIIGIRTWL